MEPDINRAVAVVGVGAILPDALSAPAFWQNLCEKHYSIREVPAERWSVADYYDPDPAAPGKTYSKIGGWVQGFSFDSKQYRIPPRVAAAMDEGQKWAIAMTAEVLADFGYPQRALNLERTGVVLGNAMGGEMHYLTALHILYPEYAGALAASEEFGSLPAGVRQTILAQLRERVDRNLPPITEDSMPGELANVISGRVANVFNLRGPNFVTDAACASSFAAVSAAIELLAQRHCDAVLTGGVDHNNGVTSFVKFCKIGALSATGSRPYGEGADGFVMGEGGALFLLKRLADAERDDDKIYAVIRGVGGASDGKGKGITAPNPIGQQLAIARAWQNAGLNPNTAGLIEGHGTSTAVGDLAEAESLTKVICEAPAHSIALGSAKSNIGHLKAGAGAAGLLKVVMAVHHKLLPPTLNVNPPNSRIDFAATPFFLSDELREWPQPNGGRRRAGASAFGFGGTNFHIVVEEHLPGLLAGNGHRYTAVSLTMEKPENKDAGGTHMNEADDAAESKPPLRGILALGAADVAGLRSGLDEALVRVQNGWIPPTSPVDRAVLKAPERLVVDCGPREELLDRLARAKKALATDSAPAWKALQAQGVFRGSGPAAGKIAFLFPGQGSQYVNMGRELAATQPVVAETFAEADRVMTPILGQPLTGYIFVDPADRQRMKQAEGDLMQTAITQPAVLAMDMALYRLLLEYGFRPAVLMGHSLGEYAALIASGIMPFAEALEAAAARGREMTRISDGDNGWMAAISASPEVIEEVLATLDGYVVPANINSRSQCVIGGASQAVEKAIQVFTERGIQAQRIPVSHAFHTGIVAPASVPLRQVLNRLHVSPPRLPLVANVTGEFYPATADEIRDLLQKQVSSPVQWIKGLETLYAAGVRTFVEVGPKKALKGFVDDVLGDHPEVVALFANHPKTGEIASFNQVLCGLYAAGHGAAPAAESVTAMTVQPVPAGADKAMGAGPVPAGKVAPVALAAKETPAPVTTAKYPGHGSGNVSGDVGGNQPGTNGNQPGNGHHPAAAARPAGTGDGAAPPAVDPLYAAGQLLAALGNLPQANPAPARRPYDRNEAPLGSVVISGTGLGLPGAEKSVMDPDNAMRILRGEQFVDLIPERFRKAMLKKNITRIVKDEDGGGRFATIDHPDDVIRLAGRAGSFDLAAEYGVPEKLIEALDITTQLAMAAGLDALREAGIPLVQAYKRTTTGKHLPERWMLPQSLRDETGVIFASAFPGNDRLADEITRSCTYQGRLDQLSMLEDLRQYTSDDATLLEVDRRIRALRESLAREPYIFDRRFLFRVLSMGHSQFAEYIGARGPNTQVNAACASTAQAVAVAEDWIRTGRCRRVLVVAADDVTSDHLIDWVGAGFLASGAAATDDRVEDAALPFDRRRHGTIMGMGAAALVLESEDALRERGMRGIVELLNSEVFNSAFHGSRLDVDHISQVMENLLTGAERRFGISRQAIAPFTVFMSHETYTPARGGSAAAEVAALRHAFGAAANEIVVANTKGFTGHPMGVGVEDVIALKILEHSIVPPVPNYREVDPELGTLNLSRGGRYPVQYAVHLAAGFGSQVAMTLTRKIPGGLERVDNQAAYQRWLADVAGYDWAETEVVKRVLRIVDRGAPTRPPAPSTWRYGIGPSERASAPGDGLMATHRPAPMAIVAQALSGSVPGEGPVALPSDGSAGSGNAQAGNGHFERGVAPVPAATAAGNGHHVHARPAGESQAPLPGISLTPGREAPPEPAGQIAAAPAALAEPPAAPSAAVIDPVQAQVLELVARKTGYPEDMLDLDLDLEADLGIDTVKQAETFAAIRETFAIPKLENLRLRDYPTLASVIGFVYKMRPDLAQEQAVPSGAETTVEEWRLAAAPSGAPAASEDQPAAADMVAQQVLALVAGKTGYPEDMLDLDLDLEADLGIDTVKQAETFAAIRETFAIPKLENLRLRDYPTLASVIGFVYKMRPDLAQEQAASPAASATAQPAEAGGGITKAEPQIAVARTGAASTPAGDDPVKLQVLALVADKTGYPQDMLDLDLDLEADLGIDTVKQAETFAAIRQLFDIPRLENLKLRDYPTLASVIGFVYEMRPDLAPPAAGAPRDGAEGAGEGAAGGATVPVVEPPSPAAEAAAGAPASGPEAAAMADAGLAAALAEADRIPRRIPMPELRPVLDLCKPSGVTLDGDTRVVVVADQGGAGKALAEALEQRGVRVMEVKGSPAAGALEAQIKGWLAEGPIQGVYWLPALDEEPAIEQMGPADWQDAVRLRVKNLYTTMRALYESVATGGTFLVSATRLGGLHGYDPEGASAPLGGAVTGFTKAYKRERPEVLVKAVDFAVEAAPGELAERLLAETLADPGAVEIGYRAGRRYSVALQEVSAVDGQPGMHLDDESVFLITGAAGGITSAIVTDLAVASRGTFYLLDLVPAPDPANPLIPLLDGDRKALKAKLNESLKAAGERPTPVKIDKQILTLERDAALLRMLEAIRLAGGTAHYHSANLLDPASVNAVVDEIRRRHGRIDVLLHAAGLEVSRTLPDKEPKEFDLVFDVKAEGLFNLVQATRGLPIGAVVGFSSVAARFGNAGQTDYSAANDLLCKVLSSMRRWRAETRAIAIDWTAWAGIGMATRGSIPRIMEQAGIDMLPPECGVPTIRRELTAGGTRGEVVIAQRLGIMLEEFDPTGGLDTEKLASRLAARARPLPMLGAVKGAALHAGLQVETTLDPRVQPFLADHAMEGTPLLPGVMGLEAFAELSSLMTGDRDPGLHPVFKIANIQFASPFKYYRCEPRSFLLSAHAHPAQNAGLVAHVELTSTIQPPVRGRTAAAPKDTASIAIGAVPLPGGPKLHFVADVRLDAQAEAGPARAFSAPSPDALSIPAADIYRVYFHGPAYQVIERAEVSGDTVTALMAANLPPATEPADAETSDGAPPDRAMLPGRRSLADPEQGSYGPTDGPCGSGGLSPAGRSRGQTALRPGERRQRGRRPGRRRGRHRIRRPGGGRDGQGLRGPQRLSDRPIAR